MTKGTGYCRCNDNRQNCNANKDGICFALTETYPAGVECPFYKTYEQFFKEIEELKAKGHTSYLNRRQYA